MVVDAVGKVVKFATVTAGDIPATQPAGVARIVAYETT